MKKIMFTCVMLLLVACSSEDAPAPQPAPETTAPAQNTESDYGKETENSPTPTKSTTLSDEEAMTFIQDLISNVKEETEKAGYETTIEAIQQAWAPYVTTAFWEDSAASLDCAFEYCGAFYNIPNAVDVGWQRTFNFSADDTFTTEAFVPNIGDSVGLYSMLQSIEIKREDDAWKINRVEFEPRDINLSKDEVIPYLAQIYDVNITDFYEDTLENGEFQHNIYVFTHPEDNKEYFVDGHTGTMYERAFFEEFMNSFPE